MTVEHRLLKHTERMLRRGRDGLLGSVGSEGLEKRWGAKIMQDDHRDRVTQGCTGKPRALLRLSLNSCIGPRCSSVVQHLPSMNGARAPTPGPCKKGKQLSQHLSNYSGRTGWEIRELSHFYMYISLWTQGKSGSLATLAKRSKHRSGKEPGGFPWCVIIREAPTLCRHLPRNVHFIYRLSKTSKTPSLLPHCGVTWEQQGSCVSACPQTKFTFFF